MSSPVHPSTLDDQAALSNPDRSRHRWTRFSLASLLVTVLVAGVFFQRFEKFYRDYLRERDLIVPTDFDVKSGKNILWRAKVGSVSWRRPVLSGDKIFLGTNNEAGYLPRYPSDVDLGVLLCFRAGDGKFLWQASSDKLPTGRVHDWPLQGVTSEPVVEKERVWYVSNRAEVVCLDTEGFYDDEDDGSPDLFDASINKENEADTVWRFDMMKELDVSPHNASCSRVALSSKAVFVVTGHGVNEAHVSPPNNTAPSFLALDKQTGKILWTDDSPTGNILHGQWASPTYAVLGGVPQVIFPGGDGWLYSFDPAGTAGGKSKLLWKFDCNPKDAVWMLGGRGTRNNLLAAPTIYQDRVYIAVGQDPEHGEGDGHLWCIDPTMRGDVSSELVFNPSAPNVPIPHKRILACDPSEGDFTRANPNSAVVWRYDGDDLDGDGVATFEEQMHRSVGGVVIKNDLAIVTDFSGLVHCLDAKTGRAHWTHDLFAHSWASPLISGQHVYVADEDGKVTVLGLSADPKGAMPGGTPVSESYLPDSIYATPDSAKNVLYILTNKELFAIADPRRGEKVILLFRGQTFPQSSQTACIYQVPRVNNRDH